jgi:hypothetical protein
MRRGRRQILYEIGEVTTTQASTFQRGDSRAAPWRRHFDLRVGGRSTSGPCGGTTRRKPKGQWVVHATDRGRFDLSKQEFMEMRKTLNSHRSATSSSRTNRNCRATWMVINNRLFRSAVFASDAPGVPYKSTVKCWRSGVGRRQAASRPGGVLSDLMPRRNLARRNQRDLASRTFMTGAFMEIAHRINLSLLRLNGRRSARQPTLTTASTSKRRAERHLCWERQRTDHGSTC